MYVNGRKITLEQLKNLAAKVINSMIDDMYDAIQEEGIESLCITTNQEKKEVLQRMLDHYVETEEYLKCAFLRDELIKINKLELNK